MISGTTAHGPPCVTHLVGSGKLSISLAEETPVATKHYRELISSLLPRPEGGQWQLKRQGKPCIRQSSSEGHSVT